MMTERTWKRICYTILLVLVPLLALVMISEIWDTDSLTGLQAGIFWALVLVGIAWIWWSPSRRNR